MQKQIERIRNNDYTHLDEKLYNNMNMTSELDHTISQLAQLQRYLKSQIDTIQDEGEKQAAMKASKVVMEMSIKAFGKQTQVNKKCNCLQIFQQVLNKIRKIKKSFKNLKQSFMRQTKDCITDISDMVLQNINYVLGMSSRKTCQNSKLKNQIYSFQQELNELKQKNQQLNNKIGHYQKILKQKNQKTNHVIKGQKSVISCYANSEKHFTSIQSTQQYLEYMSKDSARYNRNSNEFNTRPALTQSTNQTPRLPMPLRRENSVKKYGNSIEKYGSCANINPKQKIIEQFRYNCTAKNSPVRQTLKTQKDQKLYKNIMDKQNEIIRLKGTEIMNKKPAKKLKLFSII